MSVPSIRNYSGKFNFNKAERELNGSISCKIAYQTYLEKHDQDTIGIRLHATTIVKFHRDGRIQLFCGNWYTRTTYNVINNSIVGFTIGSYKNDPVVYDQSTHKSYFFKEGITINSDGCIEGKPIYLEKAERITGKTFKDENDFINFVKESNFDTLKMMFGKRNPEVRNIIAQYGDIKYIAVIVGRAKQGELWGTYAKQRLYKD